MAKLHLYYGTVKSTAGEQHFMSWARSREHALDLVEAALTVTEPVQGSVVGPIASLPADVMRQGVFVEVTPGQKGLGSVLADANFAFPGLLEVLVVATPSAQLPRLTSLSPGAGCACKLPLAKLEELLGSLGDIESASGDLLVGAREGDDAAVLKLDGDRALVLTTDFFTPIVDDPADWGAIAAVNAMSDVYAMGGRPVIAVNLAAWPADGLPLSILAEVLRGAAAAAREAGCMVAGGHTIDDPVPKYGMAVVGMADPDRLMTIDRAAPGDRLIVTKPLGTGVVTTALKRDGVGAQELRAAVACMTLLNASASEAALSFGVRAATDVTGFGLLGHLHRMLSASGAAAEVSAPRVPLLPGADELARRGFVSGGTRANLERLRSAVSADDGIPEEVVVLLHDAQTSGGLLLSAGAGVADPLLKELSRRGLEAAEVGRVVAGPAGRIAVRAA